MAQKNFYIDGALAGQAGYVEINQDLHLNGTLKLNGMDLFVSDGTHASSGATTMGIADLADVDMSNASNGDSLVYNASTQSFELASVSGSSSGSSTNVSNVPLSGLYNVAISNVADGDIIHYDSANSKWVNTAQAASRTQYMGFVKLGNTPTWHGDTGMSVARVSQGVYKVTFPTGYSNVDDYMVQVQYQASNAQNMVTVSKSNSNVTFSVYQESTGNYVDSGELVIVLTNL